MAEVSRRRLLIGSAGAVGATAVAALPGTVGDVSARPAVASDGTASPPTIVGRDDDRYDALRRGNNQRWVGTPDYIELPDTTEQVVAAVRKAVTHGMRLSVRSGGHCYEDFVYNPEVRVVIDLTRMNAVHFDERENAFCVEAGASLWEVYEGLYRPYGVTLPGGSCGFVGAGGHVCGGGYGLLSRQFGLTVDYLHAVEVVVVDEDRTVRAVRASRDPGDPHHDLWWAHTGGGGGNFGIVTRYWLRTSATDAQDRDELLPRPPAEVFVSAISWDWARLTEPGFTRLVRNFGDFNERESAPDNTRYDGLFGLLKLTTKVPGGKVGLITQMDATSPDSENLLRQYLQEVTDGVGVDHGRLDVRTGDHPPLPDVFEYRKMPWLLAAQFLSGSGNPTLRSKYKSAYMLRGFPPAQISKIYRHLAEVGYDNPDALLQVDSYGCRVNAVSADATAVPQRSSVLKLQYQSYWTTPAEDDKNLSWIRDFYRDVYADTGGVPISNAVTDGCFINYPDRDLSSEEWNTSGVPWSTLYYKDGYPRLRQAKQRWDPLNVFRHAQSIEPPD
jgi:FAD/FMN-containing dehydrogenase